MMYLQVLRNKYDQFGGRAGRREFWLFMLVHVILAVVAGFVDALFFSDSDAEWFEIGPIYGIYSTLSFVPLLAVGARRLHDTGRSGWWQVLIVAWVPAAALGVWTAIVAGLGGTESDVAVPGILALIFFITAIVGTVVLFVFALMPGDQEDNLYGSPGESPDRPAVYSTVISQRYAQFAGRAGRKEYWLFVLVHLMLASIFQTIGETWVDVDTLDNFDANPIPAIHFLITIIPFLALGARRLHDIGRSGWWLLFILLPIIGWALLLVFAILPSNEGENSHGEPAEVPA